MKKIKEKINYNDFLVSLSDGLLRELGDQYETKAITNMKNNGIHRKGILIRKQEERLAPAIYLDCYYEEFCEGRALSDIIRQVLYTYQESAREGKEQGMEDISLQTEEVRERIVFRIVNWKKNRQLLSELPHLRFLHLAVVFQILVYQREDGIGTIRLTGEHYKNYSEGENKLFTSIDELYKLAVKNTTRLFPARLTAMEDVLEGLLNGMPAPAQLFRGQPAEAPLHQLYVLSNQAGINGAGCLLYPEILLQIKHFFQSEFYILPSSIHEVILMPAGNSICREELNDMIREINLSEVQEEEILSDYAYDSIELQEAIGALMPKEAS